MICKTSITFRIRRRLTYWPAMIAAHVFLWVATPFSRDVDRLVGRTVEVAFPYLLTITPEVER